jgi:hypothetical protein
MHVVKLLDAIVALIAFVPELQKWTGAFDNFGVSQGNPIGWRWTIGRYRFRHD